MYFLVIFIHFFLVINSERAAMLGPDFKGKTMRTCKQLLDDMAKEWIPRAKEKRRENLMLSSTSSASPQLSTFSSQTNSTVNSVPTSPTSTLGTPPPLTTTTSASTTTTTSASSSEPTTSVPAPLTTTETETPNL